MSYCVNCGVELESSLTRCPLCKTPIINPNNKEAALPAAPAYPPENFHAAMRKMRRMTALLLSVIFSVPIIICPLCDYIIQGKVTWSIYVVLSVVFAWIVTVPPILIRHNTLLKCAWLDYFSCNIFLYTLNLLVLPQHSWYESLVFPITSFILAVILLFVVLFREFDMHPLTVIGLIFAIAGVLSVFIEYLIMMYTQVTGMFVWSVPTLISCEAVALLCFIISRMTKLKAMIRKKMHI